MLLFAELIIIIVLISSLTFLIIEEIGIKKAGIPKGMVREYWDGKERRKAIRVNTDLSVRYSVEKKARLKINGSIKDISRKGVRLSTGEKLAEGALLFLEFDIPDVRGAITADGKVIWASGTFDERDSSGKRVFETGVQFVNMKPEDDERLAVYVDKISA